MQAVGPVDIKQSWLSNIYPLFNLRLATIVS